MRNRILALSVVNMEILFYLWFQFACRSLKLSNTLYSYVHRDKRTGIDIFDRLHHLLFWLQYSSLNATPFRATVAMLCEPYRRTSTCGANTFNVQQVPCTPLPISKTSIVGVDSIGAIYSVMAWDSAELLVQARAWLWSWSYGRLEVKNCFYSTYNYWFVSTLAGSVLVVYIFFSRSK